MKYDIYTDGSLLKNGVGGYAAIITSDGGYTKELTGTEKNCDCYRAEILGIYLALNNLKRKLQTCDELVFHCDNISVVNFIQQKRIIRWNERNWIKDNGEMVVNADLWAFILEFYEKYEMSAIWIKGHSGDKMNELCDQMAYKAAKSVKTKKKHKKHRKKKQRIRTLYDKEIQLASNF